MSGEEVTDVPPPPPSPGSSGTQQHAPSRERQIEFLCPNGHHLHGPASLQGRAGECPECSSRFRIPIIDEPEVESAALSASDLASESKLAARGQITVDVATPSSDAQGAASTDALSFLEVMEGSAHGPAKPPGNTEQAASAGSTSAASAMAPGGHPLAALFSELWAARSEGGRVEVHLESGSVLAPDGYLKSQSRHDYGVFVTRDPDGCSTVTVVPWNSITKIILRAVKQVPGEVVR